MFRLLKSSLVGYLLAPSLASLIHEISAESANSNCAASAWNPCNPDFQLIHGKASTATTLWLLGERHSQKEKTLSCVERLTQAQKNHRIYFESFPSGKISCKKAGIEDKPGRECFGWDDPVALEAAQKLIDPSMEIAINNLQLFYELENLTDKQMDQMLQKLSQNKVKQFSNEGKAAALLLQQRKNKDSYNKIFSNKDSFLRNEFTSQKANEFRSHNKKRNASLLKAIDDTPSSLFKVAIMGKAHVSEQENDTGAAEYLIDELNKGKHQNYYAVLAVN